MIQQEVVSALEGYSAELAGILGRFKKTSEGIWIGTNDQGRYGEICLELMDLLRDEFVDGHARANTLAGFFNSSIATYTGSPSYRGVENVRGVANAALTRAKRSPTVLKSAAPMNVQSGANRPIEELYRLGERFHLVARQLRDRHDSRPTLDVNDEYDVQDLFHALLRLTFDDVRPEEWSPSYAGGASRMDFFLPEIETVVEVKKTRPSLSARELGEQLIVDIAKYRKHPGCRTLFCFVYDLDGRINNPRGIENDLNASSEDLTVRVLISPQ